MNGAFGTVYLVGAGPGDPGLITVRGLELLRRAQAVAYDSLAPAALLREAPRAEQIDVGKKTGEHPLPQEEINRILIDLARRHTVVVRLKGGDPFVFGRGGEEALALAEAGVPFEVVPGVTAAIGAAAYAGIPVTHRGIAPSVTFITGHGGAELPGLPQLGGTGTLCFYMGVRTLPELVRAVLDAGRDAQTSSAVIERGTSAGQRVIVAPLVEIAERCVEAAIEAPALFIVGEVVALRERLGWFGARSLAGLRVAVTHAPQRQGLLESRLRELGAELISIPTVEFSVQSSAREPAPDPCDFDWILLTSVNAAEALFERIEQLGRDARSLAKVRLCAVGASAADALQRRWLRPEAVPDGYTPGAMIDAMDPVRPVAGARVLVPRGDLARIVLAETLRAAGARVTEWAAYTPRIPDDAAERAAELAANPPDLIVFTNSHAAAHLVYVLGAAAIERLREHSTIASIGPVTSASAQEHGLPVTIEPLRHDVPSLIEAICAWHASKA